MVTVVEFLIVCIVEIRYIFISKGPHSRFFWHLERLSESVLLKLGTFLLLKMLLMKVVLLIWNSDKKFFSTKVQQIFCLKSWLWTLKVSKFWQLLLLLGIKIFLSAIYLEILISTVFHLTLWEIPQLLPHQYSQSVELWAKLIVYSINKSAVFWAVRRYSTTIELSLLGIIKVNNGVLGILIYGCKKSDKWLHRHTTKKHSK